MIFRRGDGAPIRVVIVDDHAFVRLGVQRVLSLADDIIVVGECADGAEIVRLAAETHPDVVLMDCRMPIISGAEATRLLLGSRPALRVVMLSATVDPKTVREAAEAGAVGFLPKGGDAAGLVTAVRAVADGGTAWPQ